MFEYGRESNKGQQVLYSSAGEVVMRLKWVPP